MQARVWHDHREVSAGRALSGDTPRLRPGRFYGRAEPPLRGVDHPTARWPSGESPEMTRKAVFSEGRTLCVRVARPCPPRGISLFETGGRVACGPIDRCADQAHVFLAGVLSPPLPMGSQGPSKSICAAAVRLAVFFGRTRAPPVRGDGNALMPPCKLH